MKVTHAGFDTTQNEWCLWAIDDSGQEWSLPIDQATCERLVAETEVQDFPLDQGQVQS